jgi:hypothetical protein
MVREVKAWQATDGTIFRYENQQFAIDYEKRLMARISVKAKYEEHKGEIIEHIAKLINKPVSEDEIGYDDDGWDCDDSPIGKCIYNSDYDYECCVYCDGPEERK